MTDLRGWYDEAWEYYAGMDRRWEYANRIVRGGRGHGKNYRAALARREMDRGREVVADFLAGIRGEEAPWASSITWACSRPTDPVYPVGSNGWLMQEHASMIMRQNADDNRKLNPQIAAKVSAIHDILGVGPHW